MNKLFEFAVNKKKILLEMQPKEVEITEENISKTEEDEELYR